MKPTVEYRPRLWKTPAPSSAAPRAKATKKAEVVGSNPTPKRVAEVGMRPKARAAAPSPAPSSRKSKGGTARRVAQQDRVPPPHNDPAAQRIEQQVPDLKGDGSNPSGVATDAAVILARKREQDRLRAKAWRDRQKKAPK